MYHTAIHKRTIVAHYAFREQGNGQRTVAGKEQEKQNQNTYITELQVHQGRRASIVGERKIARKNCLVVLW